MFTYTATNSIQMAKSYGAEQSAGRPRAPRTRKLHTPRFAPSSLLTSTWWVASDGLRHKRSTRQGGTPRAAC